MLDGRRNIISFLWEMKPFPCKNVQMFAFKHGHQVNPLLLALAKIYNYVHETKESLWAIFFRHIYILEVSYDFYELV